MGAGSHVQVSNVPTSTSAEELRQLFSQLGEVSHVLVHFGKGAAEGSALVAYTDEEAVDLLDSYPLGHSLLEVQTVSVHNYVGQLASRMLEQRTPPPAGPPAAAAAGGGGGWGDGSGGGGAAASGVGGLSALEDEMRQLQLALQAEAKQNPEAFQSWPQEQQQSWQEDDEWQEAPARPRRAPAAQQAAQQGPRFNADTPGLWIGSLDLGLTKGELAAALARWGPVHVANIQPANPGATGRHSQWAIIYFKSVERAAAAMEAWNKRNIAGISTTPGSLKVLPYDPHHGRRG